MLHIAVETKQLPARKEQKAPITKYVDVIEGNELSNEDEKDADEVELEKLVFGASFDTSKSSHVSNRYGFSINCPSRETTLQFAVETNQLLIQR